ncbi:MAG: DNA polymerase IV, partial [Prevotella sp.]|nr:DNA polymerase IV [Prevotella sp.]
MIERKIIHVDMDAFFASVEQRDNPELRGKPVAVGYDGARGVVSTASYEARKYGVHSAQAMSIAKRRCPDLIVVNGSYQRYKEVSAQIHSIFHDYTDIIEPISLDEAFLDVTQNKKGIKLAVDIAKEIKARIKSELNLTASAGVSYNKFLAKIASDYRKPDGLCTVHPDKALDFVAQLPVEKFWGVGPKTAKRMHHMGIFTGADLRNVSLNHLIEVFGKAGPVFYNFSRAIDNRPVVTDWVRKSVGCE